MSPFGATLCPLPDPNHHTPAAHPQRGELALVMSGGGALAAYQVGLLCHLASHYPQLKVPIVTGVSAGAVNAAALACNEGVFAERVAGLAEAWRSLRVEKVFRVNGLHLFARVLRWGIRLVSGGQHTVARPPSLLDTTPLREFLCGLLCAPDGTLRGIERNLEAGELRALAITASSYGTEQSVTWVQDRNSPPWARAHRISRRAVMTIDHVLASTALPFVFPPVQVDGQWFGDGGIRMTAPFSPAIHLGADRILSISTRFRKPAVQTQHAPPPPAQIAGVLLNSLFLEQSEADSLRVERINRLVEALPEDRREGLRRVDMLVLHPSVDLAALASEYEPRLPRTLRFLIRGLGTKETRDNDLIALLMFQPDYLTALLRIGQQDAERRMDEIAAFLGEPKPAHTPAHSCADG